MAIDNPENRGRAQRLVVVLDTLKRRGFKQAQVAKEFGIPTNYLSDLRHGRRIISEPLARTVALVSGVSFEWLWSGEGVQTAPTIHPEGVPLNENVSVPILSQLYVGEPRTSKNWDGSVLVLSGRAAAEATAAVMPYVLRLAFHDKAGRLKKGDLILITQDGSAATDIAVIQTSKRLLLARRQERTWQSIDTSRAVSGQSEVVGATLGIVWASL